MNDNYEAMSNRQLTVKLAEALDLKIAAITPLSNDGMIVYPHSNEINFDPCNNWNDIMPIAVEYSFDIEMPDDRLGGIGQITRYQEGDTDIGVEFTESPQRAIAICFLRLKDAQNEPR